MEFANDLGSRKLSVGRNKESSGFALETLLVLLAPFAPHIAEELWHHTGHTGSIHTQPWPAWDEALVQEETLQIPVQVNGRVRAVLEVPAEAGEVEVQGLALEQQKVRQQIGDRPIEKVIYVPGKVVNIVL